MKKILSLIVLLISVVSTAMAVPPGSYYDKRGNLKVVVNYSGDELYRVQNDETVTCRFRVDAGTQYPNEPGVMIITLR